MKFAVIKHIKGVLKDSQSSSLHIALPKNNFSINALNNYLFIILWALTIVLLCKHRTFFNCKHNATSMIFDIIRDCSILTSSTSRTQNCMVCEYPINTLNYNTLYSFNILHVHQFLLATLMHFFDLKALITMILATLAV